jgi:hypothetical protein
MSDVTALLLTIGEPYTERALDSVRSQSLQCADLVVVDREVSPFHRAYNAGVRRVQSDFFVQVDADLILDPDCFAELRSCIHDTVGVVTGRLRDPLLGRIGAVRLMRTRCFDAGEMPDTVSPDTDFGATMEANGWRRLDALKWRAGPRELWHTLAITFPTTLRSTPSRSFAWRARAAAIDAIRTRCETWSFGCTAAITPQHSWH